jgi:hypothetical protein
MVCVPTALNDVVKDAVAYASFTPFCPKAKEVTGTVQDDAVPQGENVTVPVGPAPLLATGGNADPGRGVKLPTNTPRVTVCPTVACGGVPD